MKQLKLAKLSIIIISLLSTGCNNPDAEVPEYENYDWYAHYTVDNTEQTIVKNGFDNANWPAVSAQEGYGYSVNPDSSENVLNVGLEMAFTSDQYGDTSVIAFNVGFIITEKEILDTKDLSYEERLNMLQNFMSGRVFINMPANLFKGGILTVYLIDKEGHIYQNYQSTGVLAVLEYVVKVKTVIKVPHPDYGEVLQITLDIESELYDTERTAAYSVFAKVRGFLIPPFGK